jgi:tetratricopeptide (TPR) repeat protein
MLKEKKFFEKLLPRSYRKTEYYNPDKYDLEEEFDKYKRKVQSDTQEPTAFFRLGRLYHHKGEIHLAIENYQRALEIEPSDAYTHYNLGNAYFKDGRFDDALVEFSKSVELDAQDVYSYNALANTYLKLGRYHDALNNHRKALRLRSKDAFAFKGMGDVYMHLGNYEEAMNYYQKSLENSPNFSMVYYNLGLLYGKLEKHEESIKNLEKAISIDKSRSVFYLALGNAYREIKNFKKALENYEKSIKLEAKFSDAYRALVTLLCDQSNYKEAIERSEKLAEFYPSEGWPFGILGLLYFLKKDYQNAVFYYGMAIDYEPEESLHYSGLGDIYYHQYELTKAGNMYERAIKLRPSPWDHKQLARVYQEQGLWNLSERNYQESLRMAPGFYEVHIEMGRFYALTGKLDQAINSFDSALSLNPSLVPLCALEKGIILVRQGNEQKAREEFLKGVNFVSDRIKSEPDNIQNYLQISLLYRELKDYDKVIEYLSRSLEFKSTSEIYYYLGHAFQEKNLTDRAIEAYKKSLEMNERFCSSYEGLGIISLNEGKYNESIDYFNKILEINSRHLYANYHLAKAYEVMGNYDKAEEEYLLSLKVSDFNHKAHHALGGLYSRKGDYNKSIKHYERAIGLNPGEPIYYSDLGDMYKERGMTREAAQSYQKAMRYCDRDTQKHPYKNLYSVIMWRHLNVTQSFPFQQFYQETSEQFEKSEEVFNIIPLEPLTIELGKELLSFIDPNYGGELQERLSTLRRHIALELGFALPRICFRDNMLINPGMYILKIYDVEAARGEVKPGKLLATHKPELLDILKGEKCNDPVYSLPSVWIEQSQRYEAEKTDFMIFDPVNIIIMHLSEVIKTNVGELFGLQEASSLIQALKKINPVVVDEIYPHKLSLTEIHLVLRNLLKERIPVRNLNVIFETMAVYSYIRQPDILSEYVRKSLKKIICRELLDHSGEIVGFTLERDFEKFIIRLLKSVKPSSPVIKKLQTYLFDLLNKKLDEAKEAGFLSPVIVSSCECRLSVRRLLEKDFPGFSVLSSEEIDQDIDFRNLGSLGLTRKDIQKLEIQLSPDEGDIIEGLSNSIKEGTLEVKISALRNMVKINKDKALLHIMSALRSSHPELQIEAQDILGEFYK